MPTLPSISIIIVSWNSAQLLREALAAAFAQDYPDFEVILVDNASTDNTLAIAEEFSGQGLKIVRNSTNRGFGGGNNDGVAVSRGEIVFLVNPDALLEPGGLREVARAFAERPGLGILGAKLLMLDGETLLHCGGEVGYPAHCSLYGRGERDHGQWDEAREVEFVVGAALALRRALWDRLEGFDEDFSPAYFEDTDLCWRCRRLGCPVLYWPALKLRHHESVTLTVRSNIFWRFHHRNRLWFMAKNLPLGELVRRAIPAELRWFASHDSTGVRGLMARVYLGTLKRFILRRVLGLRRVRGLRRACGMRKINNINAKTL